ncbi:MAG: DUF4266 domain-containing protein [Deltaproteobacteria bacterium]|nr:DUF4266 domain-containing protein [Deltaproteobacteria bacterium]
MSVLLLVAVALAALVLPACVRVRPWERETLATRGMQQPPSAAVHKANMHVLAVRESSRGGDGAVGGGCGCN